MKELFIKRRFSASSLLIIEQANEIINEYQDQGFTLTLRQLYYQFVSRDIIANKQSEYKRLGSVINDARVAGEIDWDAIEDRTRNVRRLGTWDAPDDVIKSAFYSYREDFWAEQPCHVEVWIEKDALVGVIEKTCNDYRVPFFACRGYSSQSEQYAAGKRFADVIDQGRLPIVLHLGDHDPSGMDMTRDNDERLKMFARDNVEVERLALNFDQVKKYNPPPNPAKETDSRCAPYVKRFGNSSWELDALNPKVIADLLEKAIVERIDFTNWQKSVTAEDNNKLLLEKCSDRWEDVSDFLSQE